MRSNCYHPHQQNLNPAQLFPRCVNPKTRTPADGTEGTQTAPQQNDWRSARRTDVLGDASGIPTHMPPRKNPREKSFPPPPPCTDSGLRLPLQNGHGACPEAGCPPASSPPRPRSTKTPAAGSSCSVGRGSAGGLPPGSLPALSAAGRAAAPGEEPAPPPPPPLPARPVRCRGAGSAPVRRPLGAAELRRAEPERSPGGGGHRLRKMAEPGAARSYPRATGRGWLCGPARCRRTAARPPALGCSRRRPVPSLPEPPGAARRGSLSPPCPARC